MDDLLVLIMAGGIGTRFWPLSTKERPKQFLKLFPDDRSLLQKAYERIEGIVPPERVIVLTNTAFVDLVKEQLPQLPEDNIIGEPLRRDTAAAICLGALLARRRFSNPIMVVTTADHIIEPVESFQKTVLSAAREAAKQNTLYTIGVIPTYPATAYGYLEIEGEPTIVDGLKHYRLLSFKEKPDLPTAESFLASGRYLWNSGMFVWKTETILEAFEKYLPKHIELLEEVVKKESLSPPNLHEAFVQLTPISIDYGVMEKVEGVRCVFAPFFWKDMGGWLSLADHLTRCEKENHIKGQVRLLESDGNIVFCQNSEDLVVLVGVSNLVVVRAGGKTLVAHKEKLEAVKKVAEDL